MTLLVTPSQRKQSRRFQAFAIRLIVVVFAISSMGVLARDAAKTQKGFKDFTLMNDFGIIAPGGTILPFGNFARPGSRFYIESAKLHDRAVAFCTVRYRFMGGREQVSRWEPLKGVFDPPLFKGLPKGWTFRHGTRLRNGTTMRTKVTRHSNRTIIEFATEDEDPFGQASYPARAAEAVLFHKPPVNPPYIPALTSFAIDVTFHDR